MRRRSNSVWKLLLTTVLLWGGLICLDAQFAGGNGTQADPWQIARPTDLDNIRNYLGPDHRNKYYIQTNDIDLDVPPWNNEEGWTSIGHAHPTVSTFQGRYDGNGFVINGLVINRHYPYYLGLFGCTDEAVIENVGMTNVRVNGQQYTGPLVGMIRSNTVIRNCWSTGTVTGDVAVGGLIGYGRNDAIIENSYSFANVNGIGESRLIGGLVGFYWTGTIRNSFARGNISGIQNIGGLIGYFRDAELINSYSTGVVTANENAGGLIGIIVNEPTVTASYWDTETSELNASADGEGRATRQMVYPYDQETYIRWDFEGIWNHDLTGEINDGYPYLSQAVPYPNIAVNPNPTDEATGVSVDLDSLRWEYHPDQMFVDPAGFRVYMNTSGEFGEDDDYEWVDYAEDQTAYSCSDILPEELEYFTAYYWKIIPTTDEEDGDAAGCPVWSFQTEKIPVPVTAVNPVPADDSTGVSLSIESIQWEYFTDPQYVEPLGFRIYFNTTAEFGEDDDFQWVGFVSEETGYAAGDFLPEQLDYNTTYYWKVVPTTIDPEMRGDAEGVAVWSFSTITSEPYPQQAVNPNPEHLATGVSLGLSEVSWDYESSDIYADPAGFRVYMNTTGAFGSNAPFIWVDYEEDRVTYSSAEIVPEYLDSNTTYYWRVIPTTIHPEDRIGHNDELSLRGDAPDCPVWRFTTGTTDAESVHDLPILTELKRNYPNPFNPVTTISFSIAEQGKVLLEIYDSKGRKVTTLKDTYLEIGHYRVNWSGTDDDGVKLGSGVYFYRMKTGEETQTKKMIMMK